MSEPGVGPALGDGGQELVLGAHGCSQCCVSFIQEGSSFLGGTSASCLGGSYLSIWLGAACGRSPVSACSARWH